MRTPRKPPAKRQRDRPRSGRARDARKPAPLGRALVAGAGEILAIAREMLRIPAQLWMRIAERAGQITLTAWRVLWPLLVLGLRTLRRLVRVAERVVTPTRATAAVLGVAIIVLAVSQFIDYRDVRAGVPDYAGVEDVAPAPEISSATTHSAHSYIVLALAIVAMALLVMSLRGRPRRARLLAPVGLAVVAITLLVDLPKGLDEGMAADLYEGAEAQLLSGFWTQLVSAGVIVIVGPLFAMYLGGRQRARRARPARVRGNALRRSSRSRIEGAET